MRKNKIDKELLKKNAISAISQYYHHTKVNNKVKELLEKSDGRMMNNQGGSKYNRYYQFFVDGTDVYHRVIYQRYFPSLDTFSLTNKRLRIKWNKN